MNAFKEQNEAAFMVKNIIAINALTIFFGVKISKFWAGLKLTFFKPINIQYVRVVFANIILRHVWNVEWAIRAKLILFGISAITTLNNTKNTADTIIKGIFSYNTFANSILTLSTIIPFKTDIITDLFAMKIE